MNKPDFQAAIAALTAKFAASLPEKQQAITALAALWQQGRDIAVLRDLIGHAHKLAGSAGSYGLDALGNAARDFEQYVRAWPDLVVPNAHEASESDRLLAALLKQFP